MSLRKPPLHEHHAGAGADLTDFGGWEMPVTFDAIRAEHRAVRESVGLFDVSHMGRLGVGGPDARELVGRLTTNDVVVYDHPTDPEFEERGIARHGYPVLDDGGDQIGHVTSGTMSPTLDVAVALGYVETDTVVHKRFYEHVARSSVRRRVRDERAEVFEITCARPYDYATEGTTVDVSIRDRTVWATTTDQRFLETRGA